MVARRTYSAPMVTSSRALTLTDAERLFLAMLLYAQCVSGDIEWPEAVAFLALLHLTCDIDRAWDAATTMPRKRVWKLGEQPFLAPEGTPVRFGGVDYVVDLRGLSL